MNEIAFVDGDALASRGLFIDSAGLCCALGYHLKAAVPALRANMDHFQASGFYSLNSDPINVASLPDEIYGPERLKRWLEFALRDCLSAANDIESVLDPQRTNIIVLAPENTRTHSVADDYEKMTRTVIDQLCIERHDNEADHTQHTAWNIEVISQGRTGLADALRQSGKYLVNGHAAQVLIAGVDSYLNAGDINHYLRDERLFVSGNSNGFIPGEGAAAILLRISDLDEPGLHIDGVGIAREVGRHDGSVPSRGQGLTEAIRSACRQAKISPTDLQFRISDQNGEQFYSNDGANALSRVMYGSNRPTQLTLADKIGEVGAPSGLAMLAWLNQDMTHPTFSPGNRGLLHLANDNGDRCAIVLYSC